MLAKLTPDCCTRLILPPSDTTEAPSEAAAHGRSIWRSARNWFGIVSVSALHLFARWWHGCTPGPGSAQLGAGPAILVANHANYSDPAFITSACLRPLSFLHAQESYNKPVLRFFFCRFGSIPVERKGWNVRAVRTALRRLQEGATVGIFPEGKVNPTGLTGHYKLGAAFLALHSRAPVYPVRVVGGPRSGKILGDWLWPAGGVQVYLGPPVDLSAYYGQPIKRRLLKEVTAVLMDRIATLAEDTSPKR